MRRLLLGLVLGALIFGVSFAGAHLANVTNPMASDLNGGGHSITNVTNFETASGSFLAGGGVFLTAVDIADTLPSYSVITSYRTGSFDPSAAGLDLNPGSVFTQQIGGQFGTGVLWFKAGACATCWMKVAG